MARSAHPHAISILRDLLVARPVQEPFFHRFHSEPIVLLSHGQNAAFYRQPRAGLARGSRRL